MKKTLIQLGSLATLGIIVAFALILTVGSRPPVHASTTCPSGITNCLAGWAWSANIGWISFNSNDTNAGGGPYAVGMSNSGTFSGYAWSSNIGWISFNAADLALSPACPATTPGMVNTVTGQVTGWARALAGVGAPGGWDGCIELSGPNHESPDSSNAGYSAKGVTYSPTIKVFSGYAYGPVIGWLDFSARTATGAGNEGITCASGACPATSADLALYAIDSGAGSPGSTGIHLTNEPTFMLQQSGTVQVPVGWTVNNATGVVAGDGWGVSSGSTISKSGKSFNTSVSDSNPEYITFSTEGQYVLSLDYMLGSVASNADITINVVPYEAPANVCRAPNHAALCSGTSPTGSARGVSSVDACTASPEAVANELCEFYCTDSAYKLNPAKTACVKSSLEEI